MTPSLLRRPLPSKALRELCLSDPSIDPVITSLKSVIVIEGNDEVPRACHRSFTDFLPDEARVKTSVANAVQYTPNINLDRESVFATFSHLRQNAVLAQGCVSLMIRTLNSCTRGASLKADTRTAFMYACWHLVDHLQATVDDKHRDTSRGILIPLPPLIKSYQSLQEHTLHWMELLSVADELGAFSSLDYASPALRQLSRSNAVSDEETATVIYTLSEFANAHPIIDVVHKVLLVAYELRVEQRYLFANIKALASGMCASLRFMTTIYRGSERELARDLAIEQLEVIVEASNYVHDFVKNGVPPGTPAKLVHQKLHDYRSCLRTKLLTSAWLS